ncbi:MAG: hypothetical protein HKL98_02245 [Burkholderiales bacterium]|nr:hypothetical protein [Burkholderiales bacterium]
MGMSMQSVSSTPATSTVSALQQMQQMQSLQQQPPVQQPNPIPSKPVGPLGNNIDVKA